MANEAPRQLGLEIPRNRRSADLEFKERESRELILGISGAIGSGTEHAVRALQTNLAELNYQVVHLKISKLIEVLLEKRLVSGWNDSVAHHNRYERLQLAGNQLRYQTLRRDAQKPSCRTAEFPRFRPTQFPRLRTV